MTDLVALKVANTKRWANAKLTRGPEFVAVAKRLFAAKQRYITVQNKTGVPWSFIAVVHEREASQNWNTQLGQGDPLHTKSVHVPAGRGPFDTWEEGAIDALVNCPPHPANNTDWSIGGTLTQTEAYNGFGYFSRGMPSPYVWAGTDQYISGKYISDHVFSPTEVDKQLGCAGLLVAMMELDSSINFDMAVPRGSVMPPIADGRPIPVPPKPSPAPSTGPSITHPAKGSIGASIASLFAAIAAIFRKKG